MNYDYVSVLFTTPIGVKMLIDHRRAARWSAPGSIKKIVAIKV